MSEINPWLDPEEVTIGGQNMFRIIEDELDEVFTVRHGPNGKLQPVTVGEVLYGDGSDGPPMGIMCSTPPCELNASPHRPVAGLAMALAAVERPFPAKPNRAARREERKRERQARKRARK